MKRGTMRVRADAVNLRAWGDGSAERRAIESGWRDCRAGAEL